MSGQSRRRTDHETGRDRAPRRVDASMGLLFDIVNHAVEPGYAEAAARPPETLRPARQAGRTAITLLIAVVLGVVTITAVTSLRAPALTGASPRTLLEREITARSDQAEELARANELISAEIAEIQADALEAANPGLFARLREAELASGAIAVTGPGLAIELADGPTDPAADDAARVQDVDLQIVTNALWAAGAEAIAVNGQRLTALSAIRGVGQAIQIDQAPLLGPYRVEAIGDSRVMQTEFARSTAANHLAFLSGTYGIAVTTTAEASLTLPGAGDTALNHARVLGTDAASTSDQEGTP